MKIHSTVVILCFIALPIILLGCKSTILGMSKDTSSATAAQENQNDSKPSPNHMAGLIVTGNSPAPVNALGADLKENTQLQSDEEISEVGACTWLLKLENDTSVLFDPVNLSEEFQRGNLEVWVLFSGMRRMNRCPEANPIWIQDMVLRQG